MMESRVFELLEIWEESRRNGAEVSIESLCKGCPELLAEVQECIEALRKMAWVEGEPVHETDTLSLPNSLGRYQLVSKIGQGGFGAVWKGFDPDLQRDVAIKIPLRQGYDSAQFIEEARRVAQLRHPNIVSVFDAGVDESWAFIVSEFISGENLACRLTNGRMSVHEAVETIASIADALEHAHNHGIIHRDVKPENILLDNNGVAHLTDFGIALSESQAKQVRNPSVGTVAYMSPEQALGEWSSIDSRTDIYSLGVVLYQLLTGRLPYPASDASEYWASIASDSPRTLRSIDTGIPVQIENICLKSLSKKREERYSTAGDFAKALRKAILPRNNKPLLIVGTFATLIVCGLIWNWIPSPTPETELQKAKRLVKELPEDPEYIEESKRRSVEINKQIQHAQSLFSEAMKDVESSQRDIKKVLEETEKLGTMP